MSDYLKMADVFKGVVICSRTDDEAVQELQKGDSAGSNFHLEDDGYWLATTEDHIKYAAHAINEHDSLVEQKEKLKDMLMQAIDLLDNHSLVVLHDDSVASAIEFKANAKILLGVSEGGDPT